MRVARRDCVAARDADRAALAERVAAHELARSCTDCPNACPTRTSTTSSPRALGHIVITDGRHQPRPRPDRRRPAGHPQRAAAAAARRGLRGDRGALAGRGARAPRGGGLRPRHPRSQLHARHDVRPGRARPDGADPRARSDAAGAGHDRRGAASPARSRRCGAARATTSRSRGTTSGCWSRCGRRSICAGRVRRNQRLQEAHTAAAARRDAGVHRRVARRFSEVRQTIERIAPSDAAVLITGEHGTGKEVVAAWLHALSDRRARALVTMNAGGLAEGIAESELFGHVKGAFTDARFDRIGCFEMADEGTLFLDEIANMPMRLQAKLLRVLQTGEVQRVGSSRLRYVNVRVLSATNADLAAGDRRRPVPRGPALPAEHRRHPPAAAARAPRRHRRARRRTSSRTTRRATASRSPASTTAALGAAAGARLAGQRPRARAQRRARGADGRPGGDARSRVARPRPAAAAGRARSRRRPQSLEDAERAVHRKGAGASTAATCGWRRSSSA